MARGGARSGAGRKPKGARVLNLHGGRVRAAKPVEEAPSVPLVPVSCPEDLPEDSKAVWLELAPHAHAAGTLTPQTVSAFVLLCRNVVLERRLAAGVNVGDANHRGLLQWVSARYKDFALSPFGKAVVQKAEKVEDPFAEFEAAQ
jgi:hypothetical protein